MKTLLQTGSAYLEGERGYVMVIGDKDEYLLRVAKTHNGSNFQKVTLSRKELEELRNNINHVLITTK